MKIEEERLRIRDSLAESDDTADKKMDILTIVIVVFAGIVLAVFVFLALRKTDSSDGDENKTDNE